MELARHDPFFRRLREQHPDVDIVMLPPEPTGGPDPPPATLAQCLAAQRHADTVVETLASRLGLETGPRIGFWWQQRHPLVRRWVMRTAFEGLGEEQGDDPELVGGRDKDAHDYAVDWVKDEVAYQVEKEIETVKQEIQDSWEKGTDWVGDRYEDFSGLWR